MNLRVPIVLVLALAASCGGDTSEAGTTPPATKAAKKTPAAAQPGAQPAALTAGDIELDVEMVNPADAKAAAEQAITNENADAEFEKLKQEIESGG
jgi:hypothetical protein